MDLVVQCLFLWVMATPETGEREQPSERESRTDISDRGLGLLTVLSNQQMLGFLSIQSISCPSSLV